LRAQRSNPWRRKKEEWIASLLENKMPAYYIAEHIITDSVRFEEYRVKVGPMIASYGGRYLTKGGSHKFPERPHWKPERVDTGKNTSGKESWTKTLRIFRNAMETVVIERCRDLFPYGNDGPKVHAVTLEQVRTEFVASYPADNEDQRARDAVKRSAFNRAMKDARERLLICSREIEGVDYLWLVEETELDWLKRTGA
jgi:hypothetical protein